MTDVDFLESKSEPSDCSRYRYWLLRIWDLKLPTLPICMLNPSFDDATKPDPTLRRVIHFAKSWNYGGVRIVNLYAWRSSKPSEMFTQVDRIGPQNNDAIEEALVLAKSANTPFWVGWGNDGHWEDRADDFVAKATRHAVDLICCGTNKSGAPKHPNPKGRWRIPDSQTPEKWKPLFQRIITE